MLTAFAILGVLAALFLAAALATRDSEGLAPAAPDAADLALPEAPLGADDVRGLRFGLSPRGYRMSEVDAVLERLAADLDQRDRRIAALEAAGGEQDVPVEDAAVTTVVEADAPRVDEAAPAAVVVPAAAPASDAAFSAADDLGFPEVELPEVELPEVAPAETADAPDLAVGQAPVEPVDPPLRSS